MNDRVVVEVLDGDAELSMTRGEKMNALDQEMFAALVDAGERLSQEPSLRAVVLSGEGKAFCAGIDKSSLERLSVTGADALAGRTHGIANIYQQAAWIWHELPVPVIAAVHGVAYGGGFQLALGADLRFAAPDTRFSIMEIVYGLVPDMAGTQLMRHLARDDVIRQLTYTGRIFSAEEALTYGFITRVTQDPYGQAMAVAREIAGHSPDAIRTAKRLLNEAPALTPAGVLLAESHGQDLLLGSYNQREAVQAVAERRAPRFKD